MKNILEMRMNFMTNQIIRRNKKYKVYIYIYIYIYIYMYVCIESYLINCEYLNNLNGEEIWRGRVLWGGM